MATSTQVKCVAGIGGISQNGSATISRHIALQALPYLCQTLKSAKQQKYFATGLGNKENCPLPHLRHLHIMEVPWLPFRVDTAMLIDGD